MNHKRISIIVTSLCIASIFAANIGQIKTYAEESTVSTTTSSTNKYVETTSKEDTSTIKNTSTVLSSSSNETTSTTSISNSATSSNDSTETIDTSTEATSTVTETTTTKLPEESTYTICYEASVGGIVTTSKERITAISDLQGSTAIPDNGYAFKGWYLNDELISEDTKFIPDISEYGSSEKTTISSYKETTTNSASEITYTYIAKFEESNVKLTKDIDGHKITVTGKNIPDNVTLSVKRVQNTKAEDTVNELNSAQELFTAEVSYDICLMQGNTEWQPKEHGTDVTVSITNIDTEDLKKDNSDLKIYRIEDNKKDITEIPVKTDTDDTVKFDTDHFTVYTVGSASEFTNTDLEITAINGLTDDTHTNGYVHLDWTKINGKNIIYKVDQKSALNDKWTSVGQDYKDITSLKLLQIYPCGAADNQCKTWFETNGYGKGIIHCDSVYINDYNIDANKYLKDSDGNYKYDVIFFGSWDGYGGGGDADLNSNSEKATEDFIKSGRGMFMGHDALAWCGYLDAGWTLGDGNGGWNYFNKLRSYLGVETDSGTQIKGEKPTSVRITQNSMLFNYPNYIGKKGDIISVPQTHTAGQNVIDGTIFAEFANHDSSSYNFYVEAKNNCAMIQTGHAFGTLGSTSSVCTTDDEQKMLANLAYYLDQRITEPTLNDPSGQDLTAPNLPAISYRSGNLFRFYAKDAGTDYTYKVSAYDGDSVDGVYGDALLSSSEKTVNVMSGIKEYRYICDNAANTKITTTTGTDGVATTNGTAVTDGNITFNTAYKYMHVAAIDNAGNVSETYTQNANVVCLADGSTFNAAIKQAAGDTSATCNTEDTNIKSIAVSYDGSTAGTVVSASDSLQKAYATYANNVITIHAPISAKIYTNAYSSDMFSRCSSLASLDLSKFDTSNVTNMRYMFCSCSSLTSLDVSKFDTSKVTDMRYMFYNCSSLTSLDVSKFDTSSVTNMNEMFYGCSSLNQIALGSKFKFVGTVHDFSTPTLPTATAYSGNWTKTSNISRINVTTTADFPAAFNADPVAMAGTWYAQLVLPDYTITIPASVKGQTVVGKQGTIEFPVTCNVSIDNPGTKVTVTSNSVDFQGKNYVQSNVSNTVDTTGDTTLKSFITGIKAGTYNTANDKVNISWKSDKE